MAEATPGASVPSTQDNPANPALRRVTEATRIPMSLPQLKLQVPDIAGFHLHWFLSKNIRAAQRAGYEFVREDEVDINNTSLADSASSSGNSDMGSRVSVLAGGLAENKVEAEQLYLMKLPQAWRDKDVAALEAANDKIAEAIRGGTIGSEAAGRPNETASDRARRYLKTGQQLLYPKNR